MKVMCRVIWFVMMMIACDASGIRGVKHSGQHLTARETILPTGSDLIFTWTRCERCKGYEANLSLWSASGERVIPYRLNSTVTSLEVIDLLPRVMYRFLLREIPSRNSSLEVSGRTSSHQAPPPVENLVVRPLSNTSLGAEWTSRDADGFLIRVLQKSRVLPGEKTEFITNSSIIVSDLEPSTLYEVQVVAFYDLPNKASTSPLRSVKTKTLPSELPVLDLKWKNDSNYRISWTNPEWPMPITHRLLCYEGSGAELSMNLSGSTETVTLSRREPLGAEGPSCHLETLFAPGERSKVSSQIRIAQGNPAVASVEYMDRSLYSELDSEGGCVLYSDYEPAYPPTFRFEVKSEVSFKKEEVNGVENLAVHFSLRNDILELSVQFEYTLCIKEGACDNAWRKLPPGKTPVLILDAKDLRPWTTYTIHYRFTVNSSHRWMHGNEIFIFGESSNIASFTIPALSGVLEPPSSITLAGFRFSWDYGDSLNSPDYFLVTSCVNGTCNSTSIAGERRGIDIKNPGPGICSFNFVQAVKVHDGRVYVSSPATSTWNSQGPNSTRRFTARLEEVGDTSVVLVHLADSNPHGAPAALEHFVSVCHEPAPRRSWVRGNESSISGQSCYWTVTTETTLTVIREPWLAYEVSIVTSDGSSGSSESKKLPLPVFRRHLGALSNISWDKDKALLRWEYGSMTLSGFSISVCKQYHGPPENCSKSETGPFDRQFQVIMNDFHMAFVTPFVIFGDAIYRGSTSQVPLPMKEGAWRTHLDWNY